MLFNARIYLLMSAQGINWNRKWNVDTSNVLCDRGVYNLTSLISVSDPHFWDPEVWTVMGTPSQPATIGQHIARCTRPYCPCMNIEAQMAENGMVWWSPWKCAIQWVSLFPPATRSGWPPLSSSLCSSMTDYKNNYYISEFDYNCSSGWSHMSKLLMWTYILLAMPYSFQHKYSRWRWSCWR